MLGSITNPTKGVQVKKLLASAAFVLLSLTATVALALPQCGPKTCQNKGNGYQCSVNGVTHTCGVCKSHSGQDSYSLYKGAMSGAQAKEKCEIQHGKTPPPKTIKPKLPPKKR